MTQGPTVVVGGGVVGGMCAYYLAQSGHDVVLLEQDTFGSGCSHGNCGYVCPSHVIPLTVAGAVRKAAISSLSRNSPLRIKLGWSPELWSWLWQFSRNCNREHQWYAANVRHALLQSSRMLFDELLAAHQLDAEWQTSGLLFVFRSHQSFEEYAEIDQQLRERFNLAATCYAGAALEQFEPSLKPGNAGGFHYTTDAHLRPDRLMSELRGVLESLGVSIVEQCRVDQFERARDRITNVVTTQGSFRGEQIVIAAGAESVHLARQLKCSLPVAPGKGYSITMPHPSHPPKHAMIFEDHRVAVTPMRSGYRVGSTMEFAGFDRSVDPKRVELLKQAARLYLHDPLGEPILETWTGWRPMSSDDLPFIGRDPNYNNLWFATGHGMLGLSLGPVTGKLTCEMINGETPHIDVEPLRINR